MSALIGLSHPLISQVVWKDQGSAFMSYHFRVFSLSSDQVCHWPSSAFSPKQNAWWSVLRGVHFAVFIALLCLSPVLHRLFTRLRLKLRMVGFVTVLYLLLIESNCRFQCLIVSRLLTSIAYLRSFSGSLVNFVFPPHVRRDDQSGWGRGQSILR